MNGALDEAHFEFGLFGRRSRTSRIGGDSNLIDGEEPDGLEVTGVDSVPADGALAPVFLGVIVKLKVVEDAGETEGMTTLGDASRGRWSKADGADGSFRRRDHLMKSRNSH